MSENQKYLSKLFIASFVAFIIFMTFNGCITERHRLRICQSCALQHTVKDSIGIPKLTLTPFDTAVWIAKHKAPDQIFSNCDSLIAALNRNKDSTLTTKQNGVKSTVSGKGGKILFKCETDSLKAVITLLKKQVDTPHYITVTDQVPARCEREHLTKGDSFWIIVGRCLAGLVWMLAVGLGIKFYLKL